MSAPRDAASRSAHRPRGGAWWWLRAFALGLGCVFAACVWAQSNAGKASPPTQGDVFSTQGERGGPCDTNIWIHAHGGRWDRCQYERECPARDTKLYGEPDRFPNSEVARMRGYARCAVDPCTPNGAQCWGRTGGDAFNTQGAPGQQPSRPGPPAVPPLVRIPGGYDPCANPVPPPGCPAAQNTPVKPPLSGQVSKGPGDCLDQDPLNRYEQEQLRRTGIEALDTMAAMGQQADRMLESMGQAIVEQAAYLAQPNAELWKQRSQVAQLAGQAVVTYFANDVASNHNRLRKAAEQAADDFRRDPAGQAGRLAATVLTNKAGAAVSGKCAVTLARFKNAIAERARAQKAAKRLKVMLDNERRQATGPGTLCRNPVNPNGLRNACVPASWADELNDEIGAPVFTVANFKWEQADVAGPWSRLYKVQKEIWGDRRFAGHDPTRAMLQSQGMSAIMPNGMPDIVNELRTAGPGSGGFVTIFRQDGSSHMFRARNIGGTVRFSDSALGTGGSYNFDPGFNSGPLTRVDFYRATGRDRLPQ